MITFEARQFECGHTSLVGPNSNTLDHLSIGKYEAALTIVTADPNASDNLERTCWRCLMDKKPEAPEECRADNHDFQIDGDRVLDKIYGTGGWDLSFHCTRKPCQAAKYTTYGMKLLYLSNHDRSKIWDIDKEEA